MEKVEEILNKYNVPIEYDEEQKGSRVFRGYSLDISHLNEEEKEAFYEDLNELGF